MKFKTLLLGLTIISFNLGFGQTDKKENILPVELQIKVALLAAPIEFRENAKVLGYDSQGELIELKEGNNGFICLAPDYKTPQYFAAYCYPESLEPLMQRGRELTKQGKRKQKNDIRQKEVEQGTLVMPKQPTTMYGYWGTLDSLDYNTGEMTDAKRRYVIYVSMAKASDLGLSNKPNNLGMPWLMDEGTYKAHIMITPPIVH